MLETEQNTNTNPIKKKSKIKRFLRKYFSIIIILLLALTSFYFYRKAKNDPNAQAQAEVKSLVSKVGDLMILPSSETPTIATVSDPEALKDQVFFIDSQKGDKVLIYSNAKKAILYRPDEDKIITIAPLNTDSSNTPTTVPTTDSSKPDTKNN